MDQAVTSRKASRAPLDPPRTRSFKVDSYRLVYDQLNAGLSCLEKFTLEIQVSNSPQHLKSHYT